MVSLAVGLQAQIVITGVADRTSYTDSATFQVVAAAGFTDVVTLNGKPIAGGVSQTVRVMDYYDLAVTRIETNKDGGKRPSFDAEMVNRVATLIQNTLELPDVKGIQIDFDAVVSEREFYRKMMFELRGKLDKSANGGVRVPLGRSFSLLGDARAMLALEGNDGLLAVWPVRAGGAWRF